MSLVLINLCQDKQQQSPMLSPSKMQQIQQSLNNNNQQSVGQNLNNLFYVNQPQGNSLSDGIEGSLDRQAHQSHIDSVSNFNGTAHFGQGTIMSLSEYGLGSQNNLMHQNSQGGININLPHPQKLIDQYFTNAQCNSQVFVTSSTPKFNTLSQNKKFTLDQNQANLNNSDENNQLNYLREFLNQRQTIYGCKPSKRLSNSNPFQIDTLNSPKSLGQGDMELKVNDASYLESAFNQRINKSDKNNLMNSQMLFTVQQMSEKEEENLEDEFDVVASMDANINILFGSQFNPSQKKSICEKDLSTDQFQDTIKVVHD